MTSVKKIKVALLALVAALVIAIPTSAFAQTLTVESDNAGASYNAYQIFQGKFEDGKTLTDIQWADDFNGAGFLAALKADSVLKDIFKDCTSAADVAKALDDKVADESDAAYAFADIAKAYKGTAIPLTTTDQAKPFQYSANVNPGYYLILQDGAGTVDGVTGGITLNILKVADDAKVVAKSNVPESDKGVDEDDDAVEAYDKRADYTIGQTIPYQLTATLPDNYGEYDTYYLAFVDQASAGLDYIKADGKVVVTVTSDAGDAITSYVVSDYTPENGYTAGYDKGFKVEIANLKTAAPKAKAGSKIIVKYSAVLNDQAVIGHAGNPNISHIIFSNNPNSDGTGDKGETPDDYAVVFTYELDSTKIDGDTKEKLGEVHFVIYREATAVEDGDAYAAGTILYVAGKDANNKVTGWTDDIDEAFDFVSDGTTGRFDIAGLDAGTYFVKETAVPAGYNLDETPKQLVITAATSSTSPADACITELSVTIDNVVTNEGDKEAGTVPQTIENFKGSELPSTGGIGTTIFTIVGIALIVAAAAIMVIRRRNAAAIQ